MKKVVLWFVPGFIDGVVVIPGAGRLVEKTSENEFCISCHIHPEAYVWWKRPVHYDTGPGYGTGCVECHLPSGGPENGEEHVVRGGSFLNAAGAMRSANRDCMLTSESLKTDPLMPESIWWYSDSFHTGLRVMCEYDNKTGK